MWLSIGDPVRSRRNSSEFRLSHRDYASHRHTPLAALGSISKWLFLIRTIPDSTKRMARALTRNIFNRPVVLFTAQAPAVRDRQGREYVRHFARRSWPRYWCPMIRHNVLAAAHDIREGLRAPGAGSTHRRLLLLRDRTEKDSETGKTTGPPGKTGGRRGCLVKCCGVSLRCCGVAAAPTLPVPASIPNSCVGGDEWRKRNDGDGSATLTGGGETGKQQQSTWTLPPKLRAAAQGAGSWGGDTALISSRSTVVARRPPSPTGGGGPAHHRGRGSEASTVAGSMFTLGQSGVFGTGSSGGAPGGRLGAEGAASGRGLISSVFSSAPVPMDEPRRKVFDGTGGRSSGSLERGGVSSNSGGEFEGFAARGREGDGASGRGLITSMFSATSVAMDDAPRRHVYDTGNGIVRGDGDTQGYPAGGDGGSVAWRRGEGGLEGGGASGRGLFSGNSPVPLAAPQKKVYEWSGFADAGDEERGLKDTGSEGRSTGGGDGG